MEYRKLAKELLQAVYQDDLWKAKKCLEAGADVNWLVNGFPYIFHAVENDSQAMMLLFVDYGATHVHEVMFYALKRGKFKLAITLLLEGYYPKYFTYEGYERARYRVNHYQNA